MLVELIDVDDRRWSDALSLIPHDFYHLPSYARVEARHDGAQALALHGINEDGVVFLVPLLMRRLPSQLGLPESWRDATAPYGYPAPISTATSPDTFNKFMRRSVQVARENDIISLFLRWHPLLMPNLRNPIDGETVVEHGKTVFVDLSESADEWQRQTRKDHRYRIRQLRKLGFDFAIDRADMLPDFHRIYLATMQRVAAHSSYGYSIEYFLDLQESLGNCFHVASVISPQGDIAASGIFTECCGIVQYHLSGSAQEYMHLSPMRLLLDEVRSWAKERGNRIFHLGGGLGGTDDSLFDFKAAFSKYRSPFHTSRIITDIQSYDEAVLANRKRDVALQDNYFPAYRQAA